MELTQQDYDTRKARIDAGTGDDDDARLVKQYEAEGFTSSESGGAGGNPAGSVPGRNADGSDDGTGKQSLADKRAAAGDSGSAVVGGVPVGEHSTGSKHDQSTTDPSRATGRASGKRN